MATSDVTKNLARKTKILHIMSIALTFIPITVWFIIAMAKSNDVTKVALGLSFTIAILLVFVNILLKYSVRSTVWILLIGIYIALKDITTLLILIAVCTIIDEFIVHPLYKHFKQRYKINKEIDKRV